MNLEAKLRLIKKKLFEYDFNASKNFDQFCKRSKQNNAKQIHETQKKLTLRLTYYMFIPTKPQPKRYKDYSEKSD